MATASSEESEGRMLLAFLVANGVIEGGPFPAALEEGITKAITTGKGAGERIERLLMADPSVEELFAGPDELARIVKSGMWVPVR